MRAKNPTVTLLPENIRSKAERVRRRFARAPHKLREIGAKGYHRATPSVLYFGNAVRGSLSSVKADIRSITPENSVWYIDFIGVDTLEVLIDDRYEKEVEAALVSVGCKSLRIKSPLEDICNNHRDRPIAGREKHNLQNCAHRVRRIAERTLSVRVRQFYSNLALQAEAKIQNITDMAADKTDQLNGNNHQSKERAAAQPKTTSQPMEVDVGEAVGTEDQSLQQALPQ